MRHKEELTMVPVSGARCCRSSTLTLIIKTRIIFSFRCCCFPCVNQVNCIEYFSEKEVILRWQREPIQYLINLIFKGEGEATVWTSPQVAPGNGNFHINTAFTYLFSQAFVTFQNINHARTVLRDHKNSILNFKWDHFLSHETDVQFYSKVQATPINSCHKAR